jgi:predicted acylesterase/phospholipase RssA
MSASSAIQRAKRILRGESTSYQEIVKLTGELKGEKAFNYARRILMLGCRLPGLNEQQLIKVHQQLALCTYKDKDLAFFQRLDDALAILGNSPLFAETSTDPETLGIAGAVYKHKWESSGQKTDLERSLHYYTKGHEEGTFEDHGYTGINAAYINDLIAWIGLKETEDLDQSAEKANLYKQKAIAIRTAILERLNALAENDSELLGKWWFLVTIAEAYFGLKDYDRAKEWIQKAIELDVPGWELEATARQLGKLALIQSDVDTTPAIDSPAGQVLMLLTRGNAAALNTVFSGKAGLALSGGGFRASLYHIGVLARLAELDMLRHVEVLSCVSGGSIIGAYYYLQVKQLLETKPDGEIIREDYIKIVRDMSTDFLDGVQTNIRTTVIANFWHNLKMFWSRKYSRTMRAGELYEEKLFSKVKDGNENKDRWMHDLFIHPMGNDGAAVKNFNPKYDNWRRKTKVPILILNASTLNTGHNWQFTASWMGESPASIQKIDGNYRLRRMYYCNDENTIEKGRAIRLGHAVAASACVPGMFEPFSLYDLYENKTVRLVDGGVHDNQGVCGLLEQDCAVLMISDASGQMGSEDDPKTSVLGVPLRANDILMERVRNAQFQDIEYRYRSGLLKGRMFIHLKHELGVDTIDWINCEDPCDASLKPDFQKPLASYGIMKKVQKDLAAIRTDLDSFNDTEASALMTSGYLMTKTEFDKSINGFNLPAVPTEEPWWFLSIAAELRKQEIEENIGALLKVAKERMFKIWRLIPALRVLAIILALVTAVGIGLIIYYLYNEPIITYGQVGWSLLAMIAAFLVGKTIIKVIRFRETAIRFATGFGLISVGWLVANLHIYVFDNMYLKKGRRRNKTETAKEQTPSELTLKTS